ncbi:DUF3102 domain-containing protein [Cohnella kolymensis]|uniref:DUF3102 domain-containing protein n=1 Tax=Cohnella kolymensis TaxID=1590652 RepID=UPI000698E412|nr:DUF3102 domain-containing protein [Cohnella kolymensis]
MSETAITLSDDLVQITTEINTYKQVAGQSLFEIGKRLKHVKENDLAHGQWERWCRDEVDFTPQHANKFIKVYEEFSVGVNRIPSFGLGINALYEISSMPAEEREQPHTIPSTGETKMIDEMTVRELREVKAELREAEERAEQIDAERRRLEKQLKDAIPADQLEEAVSYRLEQHQEQMEIEKQRELREKDRQIRELESRKPEVKEIVPQKVKDEIEELKGYVRKMRDERKELDQRHKELSDLEFKEKKMQIEGRVSIYDMQIKIKQFLEDAAPTIFLQGAIATNPIMKKDFEKSIISLEEFCATLRDVLNSKINIVEV